MLTTSSSLGSSAARAGPGNVCVMDSMLLRETVSDGWKKIEEEEGWVLRASWPLISE